MDPEEVKKFGELVIACDSSRAFRFIEHLRGNGRPLESIITKLLAPIATYLGRLWKADRCSFTEVTVGLSRLRQMLRELGPEFENEKGSLAPWPASTSLAGTGRTAHIWRLRR